MSYERKIGRLTLRFDEYAGDAMAVELSCPDGWTDSRPILTLRLSVEELRDLQYLAQRAIHHAKKK